MDWRFLRFDWNRVRSFLVTAEEGSYSAAGRALGLAQPTVGRQVAALENELGVALFERVGHRLELTESGLELLEHARAMGEGAARFSLTARGRAGAVDGVVSITSSRLVAAHLLPPVVSRLRREHPGIEIELVADDELRDLRRREADIAVRNVQPTDPELFARKLRDTFARPYATPAYLASIGDPTSVDELGNAEFFGFARVERMLEVLESLGVPLQRANFPVVVDNHLVQWEMAKQGLGICIVMEEVGDREPTVRRAVPDFPPLPIPIWLTSHRELRTSRRMRLVFDILADELATPLGGEPGSAS